MSKLLSFRTACLAFALLTAAGCSSKKQAVYEHENFDDAGTFSRTFPVTDAATCEAGRRALLSQGYIITSTDPKTISGHKSFQQTGETHMEISFNVVCASDGTGNKSATMFANALQDRYALKKVNNSASLGVGVLGSVSMPIGSTDDSLVKVASETVAAPKFYDRFFALVENFLPPEAKKAAHIPEKPKTDDLGVPEPAPAKPAALSEAKPAAPVATPTPAPAPTPTAAAPVAPAALATPATEPAAEQSSEPMPAPAEPEAVKVETVTPVATPPAAPAATPAAPAAPATEATPATTTETTPAQ